MKSYLLPLLLTLCAGMSTLLGGFITFFVKRDNLKALSVGLGFSAGVMVYVSLNELMSEAPEMLGVYYGALTSKILARISVRVSRLEIKRRRRSSLYKMFIATSKENPCRSVDHAKRSVRKSWRRWKSGVSQLIGAQER